MQSGFTGAIKVLSKETYLPIDRTKLSKALIDDASKLAVRDAEWYKENKVELVLGTTVKSVDVEKSSVSTEDGKTVEYEYLILATGANPSVSLTLSLGIAPFESRRCSSRRGALGCSFL